MTFTNVKVTTFSNPLNYGSQPTTALYVVMFKATDCCQIFTLVFPLHFTLHCNHYAHYFLCGSVWMSRFMKAGFKGTLLGTCLNRPLDPLPHGVPMNISSFYNPLTLNLSLLGWESAFWLSRKDWKMYPHGGTGEWKEESWLMPLFGLVLLYMWAGLKNSKQITELSLVFITL